MGWLSFLWAMNHSEAHPMSTRRNGFIYHEITSVTEDREGNLWLGSINGAMKVARNGFLTFGEEDGINSVFSLFESGAGELYAYGYVLGNRKATVFEGGKLDTLNPDAVLYKFSLGHYDGERFTWLIPNALRGVDISWSDKPFVIQMRTGEWWIDKYIFPRVGDFAELKSARPVSSHAQHWPPTTAVYSIYEDSRDNVWISTADPRGNGLARYERATHFPARHGGHRRLAAPEGDSAHLFSGRRCWQRLGGVQQ